MLAQVEPKPDASAVREDRQDYASRLQTGLALRVASALRLHYPTIVPGADEAGLGDARSQGRGLDVKVCDEVFGLKLLVSVEPYSFRDWSSKTRSAGRYEKKVRRYGMALKDRVDVIHRRQPYAVIVALFFLPLDSCDDGDGSSIEDHGVSSFASMVPRLRIRQGRSLDSGNRRFGRFDLVEKLYIGLYEDADPGRRGWLRFFDVAEDPSRTGRPASLCTLDELAAEVAGLVDRRNIAQFDQTVTAGHADDLSKRLRIRHPEYEEERRWR